MLKFAVLGYGVVGSGVVELFYKNKSKIEKKAGRPMDVKYILDIREFPDSPYKNKFVKTIDEIINDNEIKAVAECMGGVEPAYTFSKKCLERGISVSTSNKELVAAKGDELLAIARANNCNYFFEASVGGAIPIIRPLHKCLAANDIDSVAGILNGTTNFILSKMIYDGMKFEDALRLAQKLGYAEKDPTADVEGYDACRKIAILSSLAYGKFLNYEDVYTEGITKITPEDMVYAEELGMTIKLLGTSRKLGEDTFTALVAPFLVGQKSPLYSVNDVFNAVFVHGNMLGDAMFYGSGAGKLPTASAVVADVVDEAKNLHENIATNWSNEPMKLTPMEETEGRFFVRVKGVTEAQAEAAFGKLQIVKVASLPDEFGFITECMKQKEYKEKISKLNGEVIAMIRVKD